MSDMDTLVAAVKAATLQVGEKDGHGATTAPLSAVYNVLRECQQTDLDIDAFQDRLRQAHGAGLVSLIPGAGGEHGRVSVRSDGC
jgi:hypothetical protein